MSSIERIHIVADLGNRVTNMKVIWLSSGQVQSFHWPSKITFPGYEIDETPATPNTAHLTLSGGRAAAEWANQTIIVGEGAGERGVPVYKFSSGNGKIAASLFFLLGMLPPLGDSYTTYEITELTVLHPEPKYSILAQLREHLSGHHSYRRNNVPMELIVREDALCVLPEGLSGYYSAVDRGIIDANVTNAFLDIGGLTTDIGMVDRNGPIRGSRRSLKRGGVQAFAMKIAEIMAAKQVLPSGSPNTQTILDGLAFGANMIAAAKQAQADGHPTAHMAPKGKRYPYGSADVPNPIYFDSCVEQAKKAWLIDISGDFDEVIALWETQHVATVVLGGGAYYFPEAAMSILNQNGHNFLRANEPEYANLEGAALLRDAGFLRRFAIPSKQIQIGAEERPVPLFAVV